jgi:hypothetical protein
MRARPAAKFKQTCYLLEKGQIMISLVDRSRQVCGINRSRRISAKRETSSNGASGRYLGTTQQVQDSKSHRERLRCHLEN